MTKPIQKPKTRRQLLLDRVQQKSNDILKALASGQQEPLEKLLNFYSTRIAKWSSHNLFCLFVQKPEIKCPILVSEVKKLGHEIKKGVPYASILVPIVKQAEEIQSKEEKFDEDLTDTNISQKPKENLSPKKQEIIGWKAIPCVVDLSCDTVGAKLELKRLEQNEQLTSELLKAYIEACRRYAQKNGIKLSEVNNVSPEKFGNFISEIINQNFLKKGEKDAEIEKEAAAYITAKTFGVSSHYACSHPENWGSKPSDLIERLRVVACFAQQAVLGIGNELEEMILEKQQAPASFIRSRQTEWQNAEGITPKQPKQQDKTVVSEKIESEEELEGFHVEAARI